MDSTAAGLQNTQTILRALDDSATATIARLDDVFMLLIHDPRTRTPRILQELQRAAQNAGDIRVRRLAFETLARLAVVAPAYAAPAARRTLRAAFEDANPDTANAASDVILPARPADTDRDLALAACKAAAFGPHGDDDVRRARYLLRGLVHPKPAVRAWAFNCCASGSAALGPQWDSRAQNYFRLWARDVTPAAEIEQIASSLDNLRLRVS